MIADIVHSASRPPETTTIGALTEVAETAWPIIQLYPETVARGAEAEDNRAGVGAAAGCPAWLGSDLIYVKYCLVRAIRTGDSRCLLVEGGRQSS